RPLDVAALIETVSAPRVSAGETLALINLAWMIGGVIGISELVIFRFGDAAERDLHPLPGSDLIELQVRIEMLIEELVVAQLISSDAAADRLQHRLIGRLGQRRVIG